MGLGFLALPITASSDLVAYWDFDDISGWQALDQSGNELHAYIGTALSNVAGYKNYCLLFDGAKSYAAVNNNPLLNFETNDSFSLSAWVKMNNDIKDWRVIIGKASRDSLDGYILRHYQNGNLGMMIEDDQEHNEANVISKIDYRDGKWHHVVGIVDRNSDMLYLYIDGIKRGATNINYIGDLTNSYNFHIGALEKIALPFDGLIDEVKVYSKALSFTEIQQLYGIKTQIYPHGSLLQRSWNNTQLKLSND